MKQVDSVNISKEYVDETQNNRQEPVAWMETYKGEPNNLDWDKNNLNYGDSVYDVIPLYTEPQYRELSDEEIGEVIERPEYSEIVDMMHFARAILKKASER